MKLQIEKYVYCGIPTCWLPREDKCLLTYYSTIGVTNVATLGGLGVNSLLLLSIA